MGKPTKLDVNDQLNRILGSEGFSAAKRLSDFLEFIVSETLEGRAATLQAYPIALEVFGRGPNFDPQSDSIIRVQAGQLRLRLEEFYAQSGHSDPVLIRVPKGGYVPTFTHQEVPATIKTTVAEVGDSTPSIIVLPFNNLSGDTSKDYFSLGLTEDIIAALSCFPDVKLYARNLTSTKRSLDADTIALATDLNVRFLLEGSVRHGCNGLRISVRLAEVETRKILWNKAYDRGPVAADIFDVENEIAVSVAAEIAGPSGDITKHDLLKASRRPPENMSAYDAVLRAYAYRRNPNSKEHGEVTTLLKAAIKSEPNYSEAAMMLSQMYLDQGRMLFNIETTVEDAVDRAIELAKLAIKLAPKNSVAWHLLSLAYFQIRAYPLGQQAAERSLSLSPNHPDTLADFGFQLWSMGQRERGLEMVAKALSLTPFPPGIYYTSYVQEEYLNGRDEQALRYALKLGADDLFWKYILLAAIYGQLGQAGDACDALNKVNQLNPAFGQLAIGVMEDWPFPPAFTARLIDGLKKAGYKFSIDAKVMKQFVSER